MKTIIIAHNYSQETFAVMSYNLAHHLSNNDYRVIFISHKPYFKEVFIDNKVLVYSWPTPNRPTGIKDAIWFAKLVFKYKPSVIISHFAGVNISIIVSKIVSIWNIQTFPYYHTLSSQLIIDSKENPVLRKLKKFRKYFVYKFFSDAIICPSEFSKNDLFDYYNIKKGVKVLNPMQDRLKSAEYSVDSEDIILSFLGRIDKSKGILVLIESFNLYCAQNKNTRLKLKIAGSGSEEKAIKELIKSNSKVSYIGGLSYDKIDDYLKSGSYTIIPSISDNLPTVGIESLMNGRPLLISKNTGLTQELKNNFDSISFLPKNDDLISLFLRLEKEHCNFKSMPENARNTYVEKFGMNTYFNSIIKLIEN